MHLADLSFQTYQRKLLTRFCVLNLVYDLAETQAGHSKNGATRAAWNAAAANLREVFTL